MFFAFFLHRSATRTLHLTSLDNEHPVRLPPVSGECDQIVLIWANCVCVCASARFALFGDEIVRNLCELVQNFSEYNYKTFYVIHKVDVRCDVCQ